MLSAARRRPKPPTPKRLSIRDWQKGYVSTQSSNRTPENGLRSALNVVLQQDGTVGPRPSTVLYGQQPVGTVLGEIKEFVKRVGGVPETHLISMQVVGGVAQIYTQKDGGAWTLRTGKTFNITKKAHFCPIRDVNPTTYDDEDKVLILNGDDNLSYLDINTLTVIPFTSLTTPTAPTTSVGAGLTGTVQTYRYRITASNRGETPASIAGTATTTKIRDSWTGNTEYVDVTFNRVTGADRYHIYVGTVEGQEQYVFSIDDPGTGTTVTWRDNGSIAPDIYRVAPTSDTTAGPKGTRAAFINGQVFIVGDIVNPKYVRYGGTGNAILDFSPYGGGGYSLVGGNKESPIQVSSFRDNTGAPAITILCSGTNGTGKRYILSPSSTTVGSTIISYFAVKEDNGTDGTESPDGVVLYKDQLWYPSRDGFKTTLTKAQIQTILTTEGVTDLIQNDISRLNTVSMSNCVGLAYEDRLYWTLPVGSSSNNEIWVLDLSSLRRGAWMRPWNISADTMWLYNSNDGMTHFCILSNNQIFEFTYAVSAQDNGVAFSTDIGTGILKFSEDGQEWAKVSFVTYILQNPRGTVNVAVSGKTEDAPISTLAGQPFTPEEDIVGWDIIPWDSIIGWDSYDHVPTVFGVERTEIEVEIDEEVNWLACTLNSDSAGVDYQLSDIIVEYIPIGVKHNI